MEEQRTTLPPPLRHTVSCNSANAAAAASTAGSYSFVANQEPEQQHTWASFLMQSSTSTTGSLPPANTTASSSGVSTGSSGLDTTGHSSHSINSLTASSSTQGAPINHHFACLLYKLLLDHQKFFCLFRISMSKCYNLKYFISVHIFYTLDSGKLIAQSYFFQYVEKHPSGLKELFPDSNCKKA